METAEEKRQSRPNQEHRNDAARREAFAQRGRGRLLGVGVMAPKSNANFGSREPSAVRVI